MSAAFTEHLEATNHAHALDWVKEQVKRKPSSLTEKDILHIHDIILKGIDDANAGHYRSVPVRIEHYNDEKEHTCYRSKLLISIESDQ